MVRSLLIDTEGNFTEVAWQHAEVSRQLGGQIMFVGAVEECNAWIVGLVEFTSLPENAFAKRHACRFMEELTFAIRGPLAVVATDDAGDEMHVDVDALKRCLEMDR